MPADGHHQPLLFPGTGKGNDMVRVRPCGLDRLIGSVPEEIGQALPQSQQRMRHCKLDAAVLPS